MIVAVAIVAPIFPLLAPGRRQVRRRRRYERAMALCPIPPQATTIANASIILREFIAILPLDLHVLDGTNTDKITQAKATQQLSTLPV
jgi:hypothetical protein